MKKTTHAKIMIVDDSTSIRSVLRSLFINENFEVVGEYGNGRNLLNEVENLSPDIICLDYNLPDVTGLELLKSIHLEHPSVAVIMVTGDDSLQLEKDAAEAGASGFIHKPFTQKDIIDDLKQIVLAQRALAAAHQNKNEESDEPARATAVIADDSSAMRMLLAAILADANIKVLAEACDGNQAVELAIGHEPDFICLDIEMPEKSGLEALEEIKQLEPDAKVLMVTSSADRDCVIQATKMGAKGYIIKPYQPTRVIDAVTELMGWEKGAVE